ncbi:hypothetical protein [Edwardsiella tarda]|uniref:hypothetical protein n=1 Tax=Edwardsiella tarda TaxID=636 RepID=UPI00098FE6FB|nr:hypothetical protein [Edwardsiella tarda]
MESTKLVLYRDGMSVVAIFVPEDEEVDDFSSDDDDEMSIYQPARLEFPNGEFNVKTLHDEAIKKGVHVIPPSKPSLLAGTDSFIMLTTLAGLGFDFDLPPSWQEQVDAPLLDGVAY